MLESLKFENAAWKEEFFKVGKKKKTKQNQKKTALNFLFCLYSTKRRTIYFPFASQEISKPPKIFPPQKVKNRTKQLQKLKKKT